MAGAGFKTFNTGDVLTAADVNTYLMQQTVMVFDDASARSTALPSPSEGMFSYLKDTNLTYRYDGSAWLSDAGTTSPLTTKGDLWSYTTTDARLAVGNDGETVVANSSASVGLSYSAGVGFAQPIINSGFDIWQRGTSIAMSATAYTADRWNGWRGVAGGTVSRQTTSDTTNLPNIQYCARVQRDSGNSATNQMYFGQTVETINSIPFAGKQVTFSFYARKGANYSSASDALNYILATGTGTDQNYVTGSFTGSTNLINATATLTTTWQRFTATATIATNVTEMAVQFSFIPVGTAGAADFFEVTGVQVDVGPVALPYRRSGGTIAGELAACQRYYFRYASSQYLGVGHLQSTTAADFYIKTPVTMRTSPTYAAASGTNFFQVGSSAVTASYSTIGNFYSSGTDGVLGRITVSGFTAGQGCAIVMGSASAWVEGSAEL